MAEALPTFISVHAQARRKQLQIGGGGGHTQIGGGGGAHIIFFKMTDLFNEQYSICTIKSLTFLQIIGGGGGARPPVPPPPYSYGPDAASILKIQAQVYAASIIKSNTCFFKEIQPYGIY